MTADEITWLRKALRRWVRARGNTWTSWEVA